MKPSSPSRHYDAIDGLRAIAVLGVLAYHSVVPYSEGGFLTIDVFFAISGFVITLTLQREYDRAGGIDFTAFYWRRVLRLVPALYCMIILGGITEAGLGYVSTSSYVRDAFKAATFTYNIFQATDHNTGVDLSHTWSLGVEEQFYLLWAPTLAFILIRLRSRRRVLCVLALVAFFGASEVLSGLELGVKVSYYLPWSRFDELLLGAATALAVHRPPGTPPLSERWTRVLRGGLVANLAAAALVVVFFSNPGEHLHALIWVGYALVAALSAVLLAHIHTQTDRGSLLSRFLAWSPLVWLGRRSYGIYLYHVPILVPFALATGRHWQSTFPVIVVGSIIVAAISYRFLEVPIMRAGQARLAQRRSISPPQPAR